MSDFDGNPGLGIVNNIDLMSQSGIRVDIRNLVIELQVTENIYDTFITGKLTLSVVDGMLESQGIVLGGQETLLIKARSSTSFGDDTGKEEGTEIRGEFTVYEVLKTREEPNVSTIVLSFVSPEAIQNNFYKISKWFSPQKRSGMITKIYEDYLKLRKELVEIDTTKDSNFTFVCPNWSPLQTIDWLKNSSTSTDNPCNHFVFYESFNKTGDIPSTKELVEYKFKSIAKLYKQPTVMTYTLRPLNIPGKSYAEEQHRNIEVLDPDKINQVEPVQSGAYGSKIIMHDLFRKKIIENDFSYDDEPDPHHWPQKNIPALNQTASTNVMTWAGSSPRTQTKVLYTNKHSFKTDEPNEGNERYKDWYQRSISQSFTRNQSSVYLGVVGDTSRGVGQLINIEKTILKPQPEGKGVVKNVPDEYHEYGGEWLVTACTHYFRLHGETKNYKVATYMRCKRDGMPKRYGVES